MSGKPRFDYLIVGQGLAGSLMARLLLERGRRVCVIDREDPSAASRVAAGLVNPVTGRKFVVTWRAETLLPFAREFYRAWEKDLGRTVWTERTIRRDFRDAAEAEIWEAKRGDDAFARYVEPLPEGGGLLVRRAAHVETRKLLGLFRDRLRRREAVVETGFSFDDLRVEPGGVRWKEIRAERILFCEGHAASENPYFSWIPFRHAKGELLTVSGPQTPEDRVLSRGKWLLPIGGGRWRAGATYEWNDLSQTTTAAGRRAILEGVRPLVPGVDLKVEAHEAGIRPIVKDRRPVVGLHPAHSAVAIFNGLGSKGVLWGPFFARQLVDHLEEGRPLDAEIDVRRNL